jgi:hypothetical protein
VHHSSTWDVLDEAAEDEPGSFLHDTQPINIVHSQAITAATVVEPLTKLAISYYLNDQPSGCQRLGVVPVLRGPESVVIGMVV